LRWSQVAAARGKGEPSLTSGTAAAFRRIALLLLPPIVVGIVRRLRAPKAAVAMQAETAVEAQPVGATLADVRLPPPDPADTPVPAPPEWEMVPDVDEVWTAPGGWVHDSILRTQLDKWPDFLRSVEGPKVLGQSHEAAAGTAPDYATHNTLMSFGYALGRVAARREGVTVLDWGGGLGHYYVYARALFPDLKLDYVVKDFPGFCEAGRKLLPDAKYISDEAEALSRSYDFVFASSSVPYTRDLYKLIERLCDSAGEWLMITRTPMIENHDDFVVVQRPYMYGYLTEYAGWFINRRRLVDFVLARGFCLERQFLIAEEQYVPNAPERGVDAAFLFRRTASGKKIS
jgi:putative methyltransferase (TIGR04325 family)